MPSLEISLERELIDRFADIVVAGFVLEGLDRVRFDPDELTARAAGARDELTMKGIGLDTLTSDPRIAAWRRAYAEMGLKPSTYRSSPEQLARRLLRHGAITTPIPAVDLYCAVSARHLTALGGYDVDRLAGREVLLRRASPGGDSFDPLGGRKEDFPLKESVAVYAVGNQVICYAFNHRDSEKTCLTNVTRVAAFLGEAVSREQRSPLLDALRELREAFEERGARAGAVGVMDKLGPRVSLSLREE